MIKAAIARLQPRENKFYILIESLSAQAKDCAFHLKLFIESDDAAGRARAREAVERCRRESKALGSEITRALCSTFITPFDREDIQDFSSSLYKITKTIKKICDRMSLHDLASEKGDFLKQTELIAQEAEAMDDMVRELTKGGDARRIVQKVNMLYDIENKGDEMLGELLVELFKDGRDARDLILRKDIYDMLEKVIDRYRDAAGVALQVVLKHS